MEKLIPGWTSFTNINEPLEPIEVTKVVSKDFIKGIYKFMMGRGKVLDLEEYFRSRFEYTMRGKIFDEDLTEIFIERHRWIKE